MTQSTLAKKREAKRKIASIRKAVIARASALGYLMQPKSMRKLRRRLMREVVKREGMSISSNPGRLMKVASMLLMTSGLLLSGIQAAEAARTFNRTSSVSSAAYINATPTAIDIEGDGDLDVFSGDYQGEIFFSENTGTKESFVFTPRTGADNPFNGVDVGDDSAPTFADIDNDGDFDAFVGEDGGSVKYFENTGSAVSPAFTERTGAANPLVGVAANGRAKPVLVDIDDDGDLDAFVGELSGQFKYYENTGDAGSPSFTERTGLLNPLDGIDVGIRSVVSFVDMDVDGDLDALMGEDGSNAYYENTGSAASPLFTERTGHLNPMDDIDHLETVPTFGDMDFDGDKDLIVGWAYGRDIEYYENIPRIINNGTFTETFEADNPFDGVDVGGNAQPAFADIDSDGDMDAFVGTYGGGIIYYKNTGSAESPAFTKMLGESNPLNAVAVQWGDSTGAYASPSFADIDNDGDLDFFVGGYYGLVEYYENTDPSADKTEPTFVKHDGADNPLNTVNVASYSNPVFADIDDDGDLDFFVGSPIKYFDNTGDAENPFFEVLSGADNPLDGFTMGYNPAFVDIDTDGDLDLFSGMWNGKVKYIENTGDVDSPAFAVPTGDANPLNDFNVGIMWGWAAPAFVDIDNDGDQDAFVGEWDGTINFFLNKPPADINSAPTFNSTPIINSAPTINHNPTIDGTPQVGSIVGLINTATTDVDGDHVTLSYQWQADGMDIVGATSAIYLLSVNELSKLLSCIITADDGNGGTTSITTAGVLVSVEPGVLQFGAPAYNFTENAGTVTLTVWRTGGSDFAVSVDYAATDGTAGAGSDYSMAAGTLSWSDGDSTAKSFTLSLLDDGDAEGNEHFTLTLSNPAGGALLGANNPVTVNINDDEGAGTLGFDRQLYRCDENVASGVATLRVKRLGGNTGAIRVDYAASAGTALDGVDFNARSGTLTWSDSDSGDRFIQIPVADDYLTEANENFYVTLDNPDGGAALGSIATAEVLLVEDMGDSGSNAVGDLNNDGSEDILFRHNVTGETKVWLMNGTAFDSEATIYTVNRNWRAVGIADFDSDGNQDLVLRNHLDDRHLVWFMNGDLSRRFTAFLPTVNYTWESQGIGDFNLDGKPDIVRRNTRTGSNLIWVMGGGALGTVRIGSAPIAAETDLNWGIVGTGDFNSDGKTDLVWRNSITGANRVWTMNRFAYVSTVSLPAQALQWKVTGIADFDGDGKPDILWRNQTDGRTILWLMDDTTRSGAVGMPTLDTVW